MSGNRLVDHCWEIARAGLRAVDPAGAVKRAVRLEGNELVVGGHHIALSGIKRIICVGAGKAGAPMAQAIEDILGERLEGGVVVVKDGHGGPTARVEILEAAHPVPDERGVAAARRIAELLESADESTLVICLISGGGSALMVAPAEGITLEDKQATTKLLLACGADIREINAIRKHLSRLKGGGLARLAAPARVVTLIISDVVGDPLDAIASGPTVGDTSTWAECAQIVERYGLWEKLPPAVAERIRAGAEGRVAETPKPGDELFKGVINLIVANNRMALAAAMDKARKLGYAAAILSSTIEGETRDVARVHGAIAREARMHSQPLAPPCCLLSGGETTVSLGEEFGTGGRNQEFALAAAFEIEGLEQVLVASLGTDGTDGPTDAAGAWADGRTLERARALGLDPAQALARHDAYPFFKAIDGLMITGPTRTNVMDMRIILVG